MKLLSLALLVSPVIGGVLYRRQFGPGDVPPQCQDTCAGALGLLSSCTSPSCLCTQTSDTEIQQCIDCVIPLSPNLEPTLSSYLSDFNLICLGLPALTFPATTQAVDSSTQATDSSTPSVAPGVVTETPTTSSSDAVTDGTVVPTETSSTAATDSPLTTPNGSSTSSQNPTVTGTPAPPVANTHTSSVTSKSSTSVTSTSSTSTALFTATFSMFPSILLLIISTCALV